MFLKNRNIISKMKRSKVTDYAALNAHSDVSYISMLNVCEMRGSTEPSLLDNGWVEYQLSYVSYNI